MAKLSRSEIINLAEISALKLSDTEVDNLLKDIQTLIDYTDELNAVSLGEECKATRSINVLRDDVARPHKESAPLMQAPEKDGDYFVVPKIIN